MNLSKYTFLFDAEGADGKEFYTYNTLSNALLEMNIIVMLEFKIN